jgi:prepilin peptidase CpaA
MTLFLIAAALVALVAAVIDWRTGHIPNWLTLGALAAAPVAHFAHGFAVDGARAGLFEAFHAVGGGVLCGAVPLFMFACRGIGGGDVKLFAAIGALALPMIGLEAETYAFLAALVVAPLRLAYQGILLRTLRNGLSLLFNPFRRQASRRPVPEELQSWFRLGPSIFVGVIAAVIAHID